MNFEGVEYVSSFYAEKIKDSDNPEESMQKVLDTLKAKSEEFNVENVLIMVDGEGELASPDKTEREKPLKIIKNGLMPPVFWERTQYV